MNATPLDHFRRMDRALTRMSALAVQAQAHWPGAAPAGLRDAFAFEMEEALTAHSRLVESDAMDDIEGILAVTYGSAVA